MEGEEEFYRDLGFEASEDALFKITQPEIRKAYRTQALSCHPDKRPGDAVAAEEFRKLQKAYEVLSDEQARKAYDELLAVRRARVENESKHSAKRQKMMQDLRERERAHEVEEKRRRAESATAERLKAEIARIRKARLESALKNLVKKDLNPSSTFVARPAPSVIADDKERMIRVSWSCSQDGSGAYTAARLREIFQQFGAVEDVVVRPTKSRKRGSALLVMGSKDAAILATKTTCGDFSSPLFVMLAHCPSGECKVSQTVPEERKKPNGVETGVSQTVHEEIHKPNGVETGVSQSVHEERHKPNGVETGYPVRSAYQRYEDATLLKLRQAAERARLIKELEKEDKGSTS